jgi:hypothetical protein
MKTSLSIGKPNSPWAIAFRCLNLRMKCSNIILITAFSVESRTPAPTSSNTDFGSMHSAHLPNDVLMIDASAVVPVFAFPITKTFTVPFLFHSVARDDTLGVHGYLCYQRPGSWLHVFMIPIGQTSSAQTTFPINGLTGISVATVSGSTGHSLRHY